VIGGQPRKGASDKVTEFGGWWKLKSIIHKSRCYRRGSKAREDGNNLKKGGI